MCRRGVTERASAFGKLIVEIVHFVLQIKLLAVNHQCHNAERERTEKEYSKKVSRHLKSFYFLIG